MSKLLEELKGMENRKAQFRTVIAVINEGKSELFEGMVEGLITKTRSGVDGFGYDPIFQPLHHDITFAEMSIAEKNKISHRGRALRKFVASLSH